MSQNYPGKRNPITWSRPEIAATASATAFSVGTHANWMNVTAWNFTRATLEDPDQRNPVGCITAFDMEIWCDATETLSAAELYGIRLHPVTLADDAVDTVDDTNNELDLTSHVYLTGDGPVQLTTSDTLPTGLALNTDYYIRVVNANSIQLHTSRDDAITDTGQVTFSDTGTGTHTVVDVQTGDPDGRTQRTHWHFYGDVNDGLDVSLDAQAAYVERVNHSPQTLYYELAGTLANSETVQLRLVPVQTVEL